MTRIIVVTGILLLAVSMSFATFYAGVEVGSGGFSIAGGIDGGNFLAEFSVTPSTIFGIGVGGTYLLGKIHEGNIGENARLRVDWGINGSFYYASGQVEGYSLSAWGIGGGPALVEHIYMNGIKLLSTQVIGITYTPGVYGYGGGVAVGFVAGVYYEF